MLLELPAYVIAAVCVFACLALVIFKRSGHFFKSFALSAAGGIGALCAVGAIGEFVALSVGINLLTVSVAVLFSVPGVIMLLLISAL